MKLKQLFLLALITCSVSLLSGQSLEFMKLHKKVNYDRQVIASSYLIEKGKSSKIYEPQKIYDIRRKTSWCTNKNYGIAEYLHIPFWNGFEYTYRHYTGEQGQTIVFSLHNGFGGNPDLFKKNSRIKKVRIEIQELSISEPVADELKPAFPIKIHFGPLFNSIHEIQIRDEPTEQLHEIKIKLNVPKDDAKYGQPDLFFKVTILEIYPGTQYKDLCASEMSFYNKGMVPKYLD